MPGERRPSPSHHGDARQATGKGRAPTHTRGGVWGPFVRMTPFLSKWLETPGIRQGPPLNARGAVCRRQREPPVTPMRTLWHQPRAHPESQMVTPTPN